MATRTTRLRPRRSATGAAPATAPDLRDELSVHQEELRAQNDQLVAALKTLEEARDRYLELYDFAPNSYLTLDVRGFVREINLTAATLLGSGRDALVGLPVLRFIPQGDRAGFLRYLQQCRRYQGGACPVLELPLDTVIGRRTVQLTCRPRGRPTAPAQLLLTIIDVTEQRRLEAEREQARRQHADLLRQMLAILESERQRVSRDIHDDLGQQVTGLRLKLDWLASLVANDETLRAPVAIVQTAAAGVDRHIEYLLRQMRPAGLDELGLVGSLQDAVRQWSETFGVKAEFRSSGHDGRYPRETETHLYRIVQEALNNVHKHAGARSVLVRLERRLADSVLTVADDGSGFDPGENGTGPGQGLGLLSMRERAALIGGELTVHSQPGRGTTIVVRLK